MRYTHKISGETMSIEDALDMIHEAQLSNPHDEVSGMSDEDALNHAFVEVQPTAFESIKTELIRRGYDASRADEQAAAYTRMLDDSATLSDDEIKTACDQIDGVGKMLI